MSQIKLPQGDLRTQIADALIREDQPGSTFWDAVEAGVEGEWLKAADAVLAVFESNKQPLCCRKDCDERPVMCATHFEEAMRPNDAEQSLCAEPLLAELESIAKANNMIIEHGVRIMQICEALREKAPEQAQGPVSKGKFIAIGELKMARIQVGNLPVCNEVPLIASAIDCALEALEGKALCSKCDTFTEVPS